MKELHGDLIKLALEGNFDILIHGANCKGLMGAGIARSIKSAFPCAYEIDIQTPFNEKAGWFSYAEHILDNGRVLTIVNAYTQVLPGANADLKLIKSAFNGISQNWDKTDRIAYPMIGCGIGGLSWTDVKPIIDKEFEGLDHTVVYYKE